MGLCFRLRLRVGLRLRFRLLLMLRLGRRRYTLITCPVSPYRVSLLCNFPFQLSPSDPDYKSVHRLLSSGRLRVAEVEDRAFGSARIRIIDAVSERIIPRVSEVSAILAFFYESCCRPGARTLISNANRFYCGIGRHQASQTLSSLQPRYIGIICHCLAYLLRGGLF